jgi:hypothetical protein
LNDIGIETFCLKYCIQVQLGVLPGSLFANLGFARTPSSHSAAAEQPSRLSQ